ncbi:MAG: choice-of-anchor tandem repeat GloVer-containing protein [Candidatus Sulfotelmatobacter sp.]
MPANYFILSGRLTECIVVALCPQTPEPPSSVRPEEITVTRTLGLIFAAVVASFIFAAQCAAQAYNVLYNFELATGDQPTGQMVFDSAGNVYGTTISIQNGYGTVFQLAPPAAPGDLWTETVLYVFAGLSDGGYPMSGVTMDRSGNLYGTTTIGGSISCECGTVFMLKRPTNK